MQVKTLTCHHVYNAGAGLQAYALSKYIKEKGHDVEIIDYIPGYLQHYKLFGEVPKRFNKPVVAQLFQLYKLPKRIKARKDYSKKCYDDFKKTYLPITKEKYSTYEELKKNPPKADLYIAGSDQIWNTNTENGKDPAFFLQFGDENIKRASYAASFAVESIDEDRKATVKNWLDRFDAIAVREKSGLSILEDLGISNAVQVVDPVLLLSLDEWKELCTAKCPKGDYAFVVDYERGKELRKIAKAFADEKNIKVYAYNPFDTDCIKGGPIEFLSLIYNAKYVFTNSFHVTAFSVLFNKELYVFNLASKINSRMRDFLNDIGLSGRIYDYSQNVNYNEIDYSNVNGKLEKIIDKSKKYLDDLLEEK